LSPFIITVVRPAF